MIRAIPDNSLTVRLFPELRQIEDPAGRADVWYAAWGSVWWRWLLIILVTVYFGLSVVTWAAEEVTPYLRRISRIAPIVAAIVGGVAIGPIGMLLAYRVCRNRLRRAIRRQLIRRGLAVCMKCGYDLRGQAEPRCPECAAAFDPELLERQTHGS